MFRNRLVVTFCILLLLCSALIVTPVYAAAMIVDGSADDTLVNLDANLTCDLREAITNANDDAATYADCAAGSGNDTITFADGISTITLVMSLPDITDPDGLTINGGGDVTISGNNSYRIFHVVSAPLILTNLTVANGTCTSCSGGGVLNDGGTLTITNSVFSGNTSAVSGTGGGIKSSGTLTITGSTFSGNSANFHGGGIYYEGGGMLTITNSTFSGNSTGGGGVLNDGGISTITNSTFSGNSAGGGGGVYNTDGTLTITNSTFSGNNASGSASSDIYQANVSTLNLYNNILANSGSGNCFYTAGTVSGNNNLIEDASAACGFSNGVDGNIIGFDPGLGALANNGGATQTFAIGAGSLAYNAGDNASCAAADQRGVTRPQGASCDIGALESNAQPGPSFAVNTSGDSTNGSCDAFVAGASDCTLREAITAANNLAGADTITVPAGTYTLALTGAGEDLNATGDLDITQSLTINGAGAGITTIQAGLTPGSGIDRVFHVVVASTVSISDVTITNGKNTIGGGGIYNGGGPLTVTNSTVSGNSAPSGGGIRNDGILTVTDSRIVGNSTDNGGNGGGIYNYNNGALTVTNSSFSGNTSTYGAGIRNQGGNLDITNSTFSGNDANSYGGGIYNVSGPLSVTGSTFSGNTAENGGFGGGIYHEGGLLTVTNSTFSDNTADGSGGGICNIGGTASIANSTFSGNAASTGFGGGVYSGSPLAVTNSTFSGNSAGVNGGGISSGGGALTVNNSILANSTSGEDCYISTGTQSGANNIIETASTCSGIAAISSDPNLGALTGSPAYFPLNSGSPAIDAGNDSICAATPVNNTSQNAVTRPQGAHCDIGSYELNFVKVVSSIRANASPTAAAGINFTVTFSDSVTGVDSGDFSLTTTGVTGAAITGVTGSGPTYTVSVNTGNGNGTIRLDVVDDNSILDISSNPLGGLAVGDGNFTTGEFYTISKTLTFMSTASQDGWMLESSEISNMGGTLNSTASTLRLGDDAANKQYRSILSFSTGAGLPDTAVITAVTLKVRKQGITGGGNPVTTFLGFMLDIKKGFFGTTMLQTGDFQAVTGHAAYGPFKPALVSGWYSIISI